MMQPSNPPPPHVSPPGMWGTKLALRILQFIMAIALIGCGGSIVSTGVWDAWAIVMIGPQAVVSAVWSLSEGICILARGGRRGIHPGANVALDLLLWLGFVAGAVLVWIVGIGDYYDYYDYRGRGVQTRAAGLGQAMIGLGSTLTILHFTTFVIACVETHQRNRASSAGVVYVAATQYQQYPQYPQYYPQNPQYVQNAGGMYQPTPPQQTYQQPSQTGVKV